MATAQTFIGRKRVRKFFGKIKEVAEMPNLIEVQKASYDQFLQALVGPAAGPTRACRRCSSPSSRSRTSPTRRSCTSSAMNSATRG